jgi:hypothetical protein
LAAPSRESLDRGDFQLIVGPVMGAQAAGRVLGRFADMLPGAGNELACIQRAEQALTPNELWAELVDVPPDPRGTNVAIRPAVTAHEIPVGALPSVSREHVIPLTELVVGVRDDRFYVRWPQRDVEVLVRTGHMLHPAKSAGVAQFLADVSRDGRAVFTAFQWGPAKGFPFLPRIQVGRIVLSLAQWRLAVSDARSALRTAQPGPFAEALAQWRLHWNVPRHVYLSDLDHRLLLDLEHPLHVEELRREILRLPADGHVELQEALPGIDDAWLQGEDGHYLCELAVSLVQDPSKIFAVDSVAVCELLRPSARASSPYDRTDLAVLTVTELLAALGLDERARLGWLQELGLTRARADFGGEYRIRRDRLLALLRAPRNQVGELLGRDLVDVLARRTEQLGPLGRELSSAAGRLTQAPVWLFRSQVHMHLNRLFGIDAEAERRTYGLLLRAHESLRYQPAPSGARGEKRTAP